MLQFSKNLNGLASTFPDQPVISCRQISSQPGSPQRAHRHWQQRKGRNDHMGTTPTEWHATAPWPSLLPRPAVSEEPGIGASPPVDRDLSTTVTSGRSGRTASIPNTPGWQACRPPLCACEAENHKPGTGNHRTYSAPSHYQDTGLSTAGGSAHHRRSAQNHINERDAAYLT